MLKYNPNLKQIARSLPTEMTHCEQMLWSRLRKKQLQSTQFYRQKPIGTYTVDFYTVDFYTVDFYAPKAKLVVEVDGPQHLGLEHRRNDGERDAYLTSEGIRVLRFGNIQVLQEIDAVVEAILQALVELRGENPPNPPLTKGG